MNIFNVLPKKNVELDKSTLSKLKELEDKSESVAKRLFKELEDSIQLKNQK